MKYAICFSGAIRDFDTCIPSILKFVSQNNDIDYFLHLWTFGNEDELETTFKWRKDTTSPERVIQILKPKKFVIEKYNSFWENKIIKDSNIDTKLFKDDSEKGYGINCCSMYYKIQQCFKLLEDYQIESNIKYDIIIRARLDFIWEDYIYFDHFENNKLYLVRDRYATCSRLVTNDKFFAGSYTIMKNICNIFNYISKYQKNNVKLDGQVIHEHHIKQNKLDVLWLGDMNTYYKCMGRHNIQLKNTHIFIENDEDIYIGKNNFIEELSYNLLMLGYRLYFKKKPINNYLTHFLGYNEYNTKYKINYKLNYNIDDKYYIIHLNDNVIKINVSIIKNIKYVCDFIISLLSNNINNNTYVFDTIKKIINIKNDDDIIYKNKDSGYYKLKVIVNFNNNFNSYTYSINYNNSIIKIDRDTFIIRKIYNYYENGVLPY
jgi:hypothetical protein